MTTISASTTTGIYLTSASYINPVVIDPDIAVTGDYRGYAMYAYAGTWDITNAGRIAGSGAGVGGIHLGGGGEVTNQAGGVIGAPASNPGAVYILGGAGTVVNAGTIDAGVWLKTGGTVTNQAGGTIVSESSTGGYGVALHAGGEVTNAGNISGVLLGVALDAGGVVTNEIGGTINGQYIGALLGIFTGAPGVATGGGGNIINQAGATISGGDGVLAGGSIATVTNAGAIVATSTGTVTKDGITLVLGAGVEMSAGGTLINRPGGSITGDLAGAYFPNSVGTVVNDGSLSAGTNGTAVFLGLGGSVTNAASASITGNGGVFGYLGAATVDNYGNIASSIGGGAGILLDSGGSVTNAAFASILGGTAVNFPAGGTLTNAGSIVGNTGTAVSFGGTGDNLLVLDPGFGFSGLVIGSTSAGNTMELASAASGGTVTGIGTEFTNFGPIQFDAGSHWSIAGNTSGLSGTISGFAAGDTIVMTGVTATGSSFSGGILTLDEPGGGSATLDLPGTFTLASDFTVVPILGGTEVTVACFRSGTRILTASGEVPVEELQIGDHVVTLHGSRLAPIVWLGHRHINCIRHPRPANVWPICVAPNALGDGVPHCDLWLSPDHAILLRTGGQQILVPIRYLVNGTTIAQVPVPSVTYWHVELTAHDAIVAEGLPAETYLDTGNRADFANGGAAVSVHPTFTEAVWSARAWAPQLRYGDALAALQYHLVVRAARSGTVQHVRSQIG